MKAAASMCMWPACDQHLILSLTFPVVMKSVDQPRQSKVASYPGLLPPAFFACSTNLVKDLVKLIMYNSIRGCCVDVWRSGTFLLFNCKAAFWTQETSPGLPDVDCSLTCGVSGNVPLLYTSIQHQGTSLHVISFTGPSPTLVPQATNAGVRRSGYEAKSKAWKNLSASSSITASSFSVNTMKPVDCICRDSMDTQYMMTQKNLQ